MAAEDEPNRALRREQVFARLYSEKNQLKPPVDIEALVASMATIIYDDFPTACDALLVRGGGQSVVIVSNTLRARQWKHRLRFALAHELAHLALPWQVGTFFCHATDGALGFSDRLTEAMETEANRFASELLVPRLWLEERFSDFQGSSSDFVATVMKEADVSAPTSLFAVAPVMPPGRILAVLDAADRVQYVVMSAGSSLRLPATNAAFPTNDIKAAGGLIATTPIYDRTIVVVDFKSGTPPSISKPAAGSAEILSQIFDELSVEVDRRRWLSASINGIAGALNSTATELQTPDQFAAALRQRFLGRKELDDVTVHDKFASYLDAKAHELASRRSSNKSRDG